MRALLVALACALGACSLLEQAPASLGPASAAPRARSPSPARIADPLLAYLAELRGMNESSLGQEIARQRQMLSKEGSDLARTRLALALALAPQGEDAEILALTEPVARKETAGPDVRAMASFLHTMAGERRRLRESAAAANARLREERKAVDAQKQRADTLQERAAQLQHKLDALTELEKSLSDRPISNR